MENTDRNDAEDRENKLATGTCRYNGQQYDGMECRLALEEIIQEEGWPQAMRSWVEAFRVWWRDKYGQDLTFTQAYDALQPVADVWESIKKKHPRLQT